jgi:Protein of unknown function (DUF4019)
MKKTIHVLLIGFGFLVTLLAATRIDAYAQATPREINLTANSEPGWVPSSQLEEQATTVATKYFKNFDAGKFDNAYAMLAKVFQQNASREQFIGYGEKVARDTVGLTSRTFTKITWTKDPSNGPFKGIFAAIDFIGEYVKAKRNCGYIVLYQAPKEEGFKVLRIENNYLTDAIADQILKTKSQKTLDQLWAQMSGSCPNYKVIK